MKAAATFSIVHCDADLLVINKPAGLAVLPGRGRSRSLLDLLRAPGGPALATALPVHRIDADTSGLIIFACNPTAQAALQRQFREHTIIKEYRAIVRGTPLEDSGIVDLPVGIDRVDKKRMTIRGEKPRDARTTWKMLERFRAASLLAAFPETGRRHQIRVHLKAMGYPLAVDKLYGGESLLLSEFKRGYRLGKGQEERPLISRLTLHAYGITLAHPGGGEKQNYTVEPPKDFAAALQALRRWSV